MIIDYDRGAQIDLNLLTENAESIRPILPAGTLSWLTS